MIPDKMLKWLKTAHLEKDRNKYKTYMRRIQFYIDKNIEKGLILAKEYPEIMLNHVEGITPIDSPKHKRFQDILLLASILRKDYDIYVERAKPREDEKQ